ncbi:MAG: PTS glucose transporter subunit IIA [Lachnospiraceae bacterium]|nr:PTS glucose transporter subunit IIA [Lachnospiraceae bacterium]
MGLFDFLKKSSVPASVPVEEVPGTILQPIEGKIIPLADIADGVFSEGVLGNGCGVIPAAEAVYAPISGTISTVADTKHAVGIEGDGVEMLIHVGLETVSMNGKGFDVKVKEGDQVKAGQLLMTFSLNEMSKAEGVTSTSAILVTNSDDLPCCEQLFTGDGKVGTPIIKVK